MLCIVKIVVTSSMGRVSTVELEIGQAHCGLVISFAIENGVAREGIKLAYVQEGKWAYRLRQRISRL